MKIKFLLVSVLASATMAVAQNSQQVTQAPETFNELKSATTSFTKNEGKNWLEKLRTEDVGTILYEEDFSAGASSWTNASQNSSPAVWEYRGASTTPNSNTGSRGAYKGTATPIQSPTRANGFMIFDSDYYDNGGVAGNFGLGQFPAPHAGALTTGVIDCSSEPNVLLTFYSYFRHYDAFGYVIVTNDNFTTADTVWEGSELYDVNTASASDDFIKVDISDLAGGSSTVQVKFLFLAQGNQSPSGYYFWMLDDIALVGAADFDLTLEEVFFKGASSDAESFQYTNYYNQIPVRQSSASPLTLGAAVRNISGSPITGAMLNASVSGAGTYASSSTSASYSAFNETDTVNSAGTYTPTTVGAYTVDFEVAADSADDYDVDNAMSKEFNVSERVFAWDDGEVDGGISWSSGGHSIFARFDFAVDDTISMIEFGIWSSATFASSDGAAVLVGVWPVTGGTMAGTGTVDLTTPLFGEYRIMSSSEYTDGTNNNLVKVAFSEPKAVPAGEYLIGYALQSGTIRTATAANPVSPLNAYLDAASAGAIDGWVDNMPIIHVTTWSSTLCQNTTIVTDHDVNCDLVGFTADIQSIVSSNGSNVFTYVWSTGETTADINVDAEGSYGFTVTDGNLCTASHNFTVANSEFNCNLDINELSGESFGFSVVPNPNHGIFNLVFESAKSESVQIVVQSAKGDIVYQEGLNISNGLNSNLNLSGLSGGVYFVKVVGDNSTKIEKIVIQ